MDRTLGGVLGTFARSPRRFVLAAGQAPQLPSSWHSVSFDGISVSVPNDWTVKRTNYTSGIGQICWVSAWPRLGGLSCVEHGQEVLRRCLSSDRSVAATSR